MKTMYQQGLARSSMTLVLSGLLLFTDANAHEYSNLNEYQIDRTNDTISSSIVQIQVFLADIFKQKHISDRWPDLKLMVLRDDLLHQKEEAEMGLEYFLSTGINIQSPDTLLANPLVGRSVAASQVVETAYAMINYINTLENQDAFIKDIYASGKAAWMYNLLAAQRDKMDIYRALFIALPSPNAATTTVTTPVTQMAVVPVLLYLFGALGLCALVTMLVKPGKTGSETGPKHT